MLARLEINQASLNYINDKTKNKTKVSLYSKTYLIHANFDKKRKKMRKKQIKLFQ